MTVENRYGPDWRKLTAVVTGVIAEVVAIHQFYLEHPFQGAILLLSMINMVAYLWAREINEPNSRKTITKN